MAVRKKKSGSDNGPEAPERTRAVEELQNVGADGVPTLPIHPESN